MEFREIDKTNYWDCMALTIDGSQEGFVADNKQSLVEAAYEDGLYTLGIYHEETMVGFVLYDYDDTFPGWSMSRFMIGKQYQGKGYGKMLIEFVANRYRDQYKILQVGTGDSPLTVPFYEACGFAVVDRESDYFLRHYDHPILEAGVLLRDRVILQKSI